MGSRSPGAWIGVAATLLLACTAHAQLGTGGFGLPKAGAPAAKAAHEPSESSELVQVTATQSASAIAPGATVDVAIAFTIPSGWHIWVHETQARALPGVAVFDGALFTTLSLASETSGLRLTGVQWPAPHTARADVGEGPQSYAVYEGSGTIFARLQVSEDATGDLATDLVLSVQACNATNCLPPGDLRVPVQVRVQAGATAPAAGTAFRGLDPARMVAASGAEGSAPAASTDGSIRFDVFGANFDVDPRGTGLLLVLLVAFLGGALLNFTPCVLPVIPLKIMSLSAAAGDRARCLRLGLVMSAGVVAFWLGLGVLVGGISGFTAANQLFQYPAFTIALGLFIAVMAVGMAGFFSVNLPQWVHGIEASHESAGGSFVMGVMTAVLSTPCTAPLMGAAAGWAATSGSLPTVLAVFGTIGAGMAAPYLLLSAYPQLARSMPRSGPASEVVKQVMGLLLLAAAAFFIGAGVNGLREAPGQEHWWLVGAIGAAAGLWLAWRTIRLARRLPSRLVFVTLGLLIAVLSVGITRALGMESAGWVPYSAETLAKAKAEGKVVVLDFTAEWCLNCKALESAVLHRADVVDALAEPEVVAIKVDITNRRSDGWNLLHAYDRVSIPLLVVQSPEGKVLLKSDAYTPEQVLSALKQAAPR
jgi:thiol:disulfide interchange protein DsbD